MNEQTQVETLRSALHYDVGQGLMEDFDSLKPSPPRRGRPPSKALAEFNAIIEEEATLADRARDIARVLTGRETTENGIYREIRLRFGPRNALALTKAIIEQLKSANWVESVGNKLIFNRSTT